MTKIYTCCLLFIINKRGYRFLLLICTETNIFLISSDTKYFHTSFTDYVIRILLHSFCVLICLFDCFNCNVYYIPIAITGYSIPFYYGKLFTQDISPFLIGSIFPATLKPTGTYHTWNLRAIYHRFDGIDLVCH